jgi:hypothetical protein
MPAKAGIQTWPHVLRLRIPAFRGKDKRRASLARRSLLFQVSQPLLSEELLSS